MLNNELIGTLLGDAYITVRKNYLRFAIEHCLAQLDYLQHKSQILEDFGATCLYKRKTRNIYRSETTIYGYPDIYEICYPDGNKNIVNILNKSTNPIITVAYWLMDDGCISLSTQNSGRKSPRFALATCSESVDTLSKVISWFNFKMNLEPYIMIQRNTKRKKEWNLLKFSVQDTMTLWHQVRDIILAFPSMQHKFRYVETEYQNLLKEYNTSKSGEQTDIDLPGYICRTYVKRKRKKLRIKNLNDNR